MSVIENGYKRKINILILLMVSALIFNIVASSANGETLWCYIRSPSGTIASDSTDITDCSESTDTCTATCDPSTTPVCCNEEGQYTWGVFDDPPEFTCGGDSYVDPPPLSISSHAYYVNWDTSEYCTSTCTGKTVYWALGGDDCNPDVEGIQNQCCCLDDGGAEFRRARMLGTDATYPPDPADDACCVANNKCVYNSVCYNSGSVHGLIPNSNYCDSGMWKGGDAGQVMCDAIVGLDHWNLGGEDCDGAGSGDCANECCGDDTGSSDLWGEYRIECKDAEGGAFCAGSTDNKACCTRTSSENNDCVFDGVCYSHLSEHNSRVCNDGIWVDKSGPTVWVNATPPEATTIWQNTDAKAGVNCSSVGAPCDIPSYRLILYDVLGSGACPRDYDIYVSIGVGSPQPISTHKWVCAAANDTADNSGFSPEMVEFKIDKIPPTITDDYANDDVWVNVDQTVTLDPQDITGGTALNSGIKNVSYCIEDYTATPSCIPDTLIDVPGPYVINHEAMEGEYLNKTIRYQAWDIAKNPSDIGFYHAKIDKQKPDVSVRLLPLGPISPSGWYADPALARVVCDDLGGSGCDASTYRIKIYGPTRPLKCPDDYAEYTSSDGAVIESHNWICAAGFDNVGNYNVSEPVEFRVDTGDELWVIMKPLPLWTNTTFFNVSWGSGSYGPSGLYEHEVEKRVSRCKDSDWEIWKKAASESAIFGPAENNCTYHFRARVKNKAGVTSEWSNEVNTTIDLERPVCEMIGPEGEYSGRPITIRWKSRDNVSGVEYTEVEYSRDMGNNWENIESPHDFCDDPVWVPDHGDGSYMSQCNGADGYTYTFRCRGVDYAKNTGYWSAWAVTTVDLSPPDAWFHALPEWYNSTSIELIWDGYDNGSGIDCYEIKWYNGTWDYVVFNSEGDEAVCEIIKGRIEAGDMFIPFGEDIYNVTGDVIDVIGRVENNKTYNFSIRAKDRMDQWGEWANASTTIDLNKPVITLTVEDQDGTDMGSGNKVISAQDVRKVTITSNATDNISGIMNNTILYYITNVFHKKECGKTEGPYPPHASICSATIDFAEDVQVKYKIVARDKAWNEKREPDTGWNYIVTHPLANFVTHDLYLVIGNSFDVEVQVRNLQSSQDKITLILDSYPLAGFINPGSEAEIGPKGRSLSVILNPDEQKSFHVRVLTSDVGSFVLKINATSDINLGLKDSDTLTISVNFPASFPGLDAWGMIVLIALSVVVYWKVSGKE